MRHPYFPVYHIFSLLEIQTNTLEPEGGGRIGQRYRRMSNGDGTLRTRNMRHSLGKK